MLYEAWTVGTPTKASHGIHAIGRIEPELRRQVLGERGRLQRALSATLIGASRGARRRLGNDSTAASRDTKTRLRGGSHAELYDDMNNGDAVEYWEYWAGRIPCDLGARKKWGTGSDILHG